MFRLGMTLDRFFVVIAMSALLLGFASLNHASEKETVIRVAVATNFAPVLARLSEHYSNSSNSEIEAISGSTGKLFAQIANGMHVDVFLAADQERPNRLVRNGLAHEDSKVTYAQGRLVWWQPNARPTFHPPKPRVVGPEVRYIALAQPKIAPYGLAAQQALKQCFHYESERVRFVFGENVGQTFAQIVTGNADAGFVALTNMRQAPSINSSTYELVPQHCHDPINQDAVVVRSGENESQAKHFLRFLRKETTKEVIRQFGYDVP